MSNQCHQWVLTLEEYTGGSSINDQPIDELLDEYERLFWSAVQDIPDKRNINWEATDAIYRLRTLWWRSTGKEAPLRALNPESTFANFLRDIFAFLQIDGDPISAFRRWSKLRDDGVYQD